MKGKMNKRGSEYYYIIISFIIGFLILGVSLQLIFDFGGKDDFEYEACRNSIIVRSNAPEYNSEWTGTTPISFKNSYPLKCQTNVITIEKEDIKDINKTIADALVSCWALYGNGDSNPFPSSWFGSTSYCVPCARIHLTNEAKDELKQLDKDIFIRDILDDRMRPEYSYYSYLRDSGDQFPAFNPASGTYSSQDGEQKSAEFIFQGEKFIVGRNIYVNLLNRINQKTEFLASSEVILPNKINLDNGDILINYGVNLGGGNIPYIPYLFYFQQGQINPEPLQQLTNDFIGTINFCENWEGVPA